MTNDFTLDDFSKHLQSIEMQGLQAMLGRMPGTAEMIREGEDPRVALRRAKRMIDAMTPEERADPGLIDANARERIATPAGVQPEAVAQLLKQFEMVRDLMRRMMNMTLWERIKMVTGLGRRRTLPPPT